MPDTPPERSVQLTFGEDALVASHEYAAPLVAAGRVCHGGFDATGAYVSPRTLHRVPAIEAWQRRHRNLFGTELLELALDEFPEHFPNVDQAKLLISRGAPEPV